MKENVKKLSAMPRLSVKEILYSLCAQLLCAALAMALSRVNIGGNISPFGISLISGCPVYLLSGAIIGCVAGYIFQFAGFGIFRYLAACVAVLAIRIMCSSLTDISRKLWFLCSISLCVTLATGLVALSDRPFAPLLVVVEALMGTAATALIYFAFSSLRKTGIHNKTAQFCSVIVICTLACAGALTCRVGYISLGRVLFSTLVLSAARFGGLTGGMASGIACSGAAILTQGGDLVYIIYAIGGMAAGVLRSKGRYAQLVGFLLTGILCCIGARGVTAQSITPVVEMFFGCGIFLILPRSFNLKLGKLFSAETHFDTSLGLKKAVTMRLSFASGALREVSLTAEQVAKELSKINIPEPISIIKAVRLSACKGCQMWDHCWNTKKEDTLFALGEVLNLIKADKKPQENGPIHFLRRCVRLDGVCATLKSEFADYAQKKAAENRLNEVRAVVCDQFDGISQMLQELANELDNDEQYDTLCAARISSALKDVGICAAECVCHKDKYGRLTVEATAPDNGFGLINKLKIMRIAQNVCDRDFEPPTLVRNGEQLILTLNERAKYTAEFGVCQINCKGSTICGDSYNYFYDGKGRAVMVLSDGMGAGGRAAVDSAMATGLISRLVKAGFGYDSSLKILNSSMLFKSTDESLATVDITCLDLFTGQVELLKAGAAPTIIRRSGIAGKAQSTSLPAGILREVGFDKATVKIHAGDIVLMMSDGVSDSGTQWIYDELECWGNGTAQSLSERIANEARRRRSDGHEDDITVMAAIIERA